MNIKEAKQEVINTVKAYLHRDETGAYAIPPERQRTILLIGPPGIGKTAIMEQVAHECGIGLVSYTITHHTRQSAIGLPFISHKSFGGEEYAVTEYTMSEIVASVYDRIEESGVQEGILFLDEINCVSETLAPTMLQFLQYKMFGTHKIPDGFLIVTAGNPPQYNKSVRDFDIVTLDRVKRIDIEEDFSVFKEYAYKMGLHGSIMAYLEIKKQDFYAVQTLVDGKQFVTARGWEDLSRVLTVYEEMGIPVTEGLIAQYLQHREIARSFATYYELYQKYKAIYKIPEILAGRYPAQTKSMQEAPFDEKLSLIGLLIDSLGQEFTAYAHELSVNKSLLSKLSTLRNVLKTEGGGGKTAAAVVEKLMAEHEKTLEKNRKLNLVSAGEIREGRMLTQKLAALLQKLTLEGRADARSDFGIAKCWFDEQERVRREKISETSMHLTNSFGFLSHTYGEGQEMVLFLSELAAGYYSLKFIHECGNDAYYRYNKLLLLRDREETLQAQALELLQM